MERHHRRIRRKAKAIHFGLLPLALVAPVFWIYFAYGTCQEAESPPLLAFCRFFRLLPLLPALIGASIVAWIIRDLAVVGAEKFAEKHGLKHVEPKLSHALHGYRTIDARHRRHVHFAGLQVVLVASALIAWLAVMAYRTTH